MERVRLLKPVTVAGVDIFGRSAKILFSPVNSSGWFWKNGENYFAITSSLATCMPRRICLQNDRQKLEAYEHVGPLRWTGLDGILVESNNFPPYFGRSLELWEELKPFCFLTKEKVSWSTVIASVKVAHADNASRWLEMRPSIDGRPCLKITVIVDYPGIGSKERIYQFPGSGQLLKKIIMARTLGWPRWLYYLSHYGPTSLWFHHHRIAWPQQYSSDVILGHILNHRAADLLGALSLFSNQGLLAGEIFSHCAGHEADIGLIHKIQPLLCSL